MAQARQAPDRRPAAVALIHAVEGHSPARHVRRRQRARRAEAGVVAGAQQVEAAVHRAVDQPHLTDAADPLGPAPRREALVAHRLEGGEGLRPEPLRRVHDHPAVADRAAELVADAGPAGRRIDPELEADRARVREVALIDLKRPLGDADRAHDLGDHEVEVEVALTVDVRQLVDRDPRDLHLDVGAVRRIEAAQEHLLPLALGPVLTQQHARHQPQQVVRRAPPRRHRDLRRLDHPLRGEHRRTLRAHHRRIARQRSSQTRLPERSGRRRRSPRRGRGHPRHKHAGEREQAAMSPPCMPTPDHALAPYANWQPADRRRGRQPLARSARPRSCCEAHAALPCHARPQTRMGACARPRSAGCPPGPGPRLLARVSTIHPHTRR